MIKVFIGILGKASKSSFWQYVILILKRDWIKFEIVLLSLSLGFSLEYQGHPNTKYQQIINIDHGVYHLGGGGFSNRERGLYITYPDILSGIYSDILSGICCDIDFDILSGILFDLYSDILSNILSGIPSTNPILRSDTLRSFGHFGHFAHS
jgi:hypothetical protein